jgi:hypothetical protein
LTYPAAADHRDHAGEHDLVRIVGVGEREPAFDARFLSTIADRGRIGAPAAQQLERVHQQGLARAGLARDHRHAGAEGEQ